MGGLYHFTFTIVLYLFHAKWEFHNLHNMGITHEFNLDANVNHAYAARFFTSATMNMSFEEYHWKFFEEFCMQKCAAVRGKTISQLEAGSEFTERCDTSGGIQVRRS